MWIPLVVLSVQEDDKPTNWLASWWDFSSFGPDLLIGIGTGLIVAMIVLGTERRLAKRARSLEVTNAEAAVVQKARSVLRHPLVWDPNALDLTPSRDHLERLIPVVQAVPTGEPLELFPGVHHAHRVVQLLDDVESSADSVFTQQDHYEVPRDAGAVSEAIAHNIRRLLHPPYNPTWEWDWPELDGWNRYPQDLKAQIENDSQLRQYMDEYVRNRRLLEAHRQAFLEADSLWRVEEWSASTARFAGAPHNFSRSFWRKRRYEQAVAKAKARAEETASHNITAIDPMAY